MNDILDLLRIACKQGKMMLNVWHGAERGYQGNLANASNGWTIEYDSDPLTAIEKVLRIRYGSMLERQRAEEPPEAESDGIDNLDVEEAVRFVLSRRGFDDLLTALLIEEIIERLIPLDQPNLHDDTPASEVDEFAGLL